MEYLKRRESHPQLLAEHQDMIRAIEKGDEEEAIRITRQHIENQVKTVSGLLRGQ